MRRKSLWPKMPEMDEEGDDIADFHRSRRRSCTCRQQPDPPCPDKAFDMNMRAEQRVINHQQLDCMARVVPSMEMNGSSMPGVLIVNLREKSLPGRVMRIVELPLV